MVLRPRNGISLCAGGGGLDMGLMLAEPGFHTRCFVEWEEYPRQCLIAAQRAGYFATAPIWDDVTTFDAKPFAGAFDTLLAGYPCQPFSHAGQRRGADDERHLWPDVARIIGELGDGLRWVFLENVAGHVTLGLETVLRDLWNLGFTPAAGLFTAAETGAPHERERVFIVAHRARVGTGEPDNAQRTVARGEPWGGSCRCGLRLHGNELADADGWNPGAEREQRGREQRLQPEGGCPGGGRDGAVDDASRHHRGIHAGRREEGCGAPDAGRRGRTVGNASRIGCGEGQPEPSLRGGRNAATGAGGTVGHPASARCEPAREGASRLCGSGEQMSRAGGSAVADASGAGLEGRERGGPSGERHGPPAHGSTAERCRPWLHPPGPADMDAWREVLRVAPHLAPAVSVSDVNRFADHCAQMVARGELAEATAQSLVRRVVAGLSNRSRALRVLGNAVHPLTAAYAWRTLTAAHGLQPIDLEGAE